MVGVHALDIGVQYSLLVGLGELVLVALPNELGGGVDEQHLVVELGLLQHDDAGRDRGAEEQIGRQLDHRIDIVVVDQVFADLLLRATAIEDAGELDDRRGAVDGQPAQHVHGERQIGLALRCQHPGRGEPWVVDQQRVGVPLPLDRIRRIRHDRLERLIVPVRRVGQRVAVGDVELLVVDVVQEHVDPAQVIGGQIDLLTEEPPPHILLAEHLGELQQQRPRPARRVVDLVHLGLADHGDLRQQL